MRTRRNVSLSSEVNEHIQKQAKRYGFDFSKWVEDTYRKMAMSPERILKDIETAEIAIAQMRHDYEVVKSLLDSRVAKLSKNEERWITSELKARLARNGNNWGPILNVFNLSFSRNYNESEFRTLCSEVFDERTRLEHV